MNDKIYFDKVIALLTADFMGVDVEMLVEAKHVWRTKQLPESSMLDLLVTSATDVATRIKNMGLETTADRYARVFEQTYEFPMACSIIKYKDFLSMTPLRFALGDCTCGGISSRSKFIEVFAHDLSFAQVLNYCLEQGIDPDSVLKLVWRKNLDYIHAEPITHRDKWHMAGGNYIYTSDSRYKSLTGINYPVAIHDRVEE